jgi:hypothetical protein
VVEGFHQPCVVVLRIPVLDDALVRMARGVRRALHDRETDFQISSSTGRISVGKPIRPARTKLPISNACSINLYGRRHCPRQVLTPVNHSPSPNLRPCATLLKVGLCVVIGYVIGLTTQRVELSTILITVVITALPTYGAALNKMVLRIVGALIGGAASLIAIIIVSPNFETLGTYMLVLFVVFYFSGYSSLTSGRVSYAGSQIGTTFAIVFAGLSPAVDIYEPLWRIWGILLGCFVVALVFLMLVPEYAADSLLPRLRKAIRATLALIPEGSALYSEDQIQQTNSEVMRLVAEILEVANDAQVEGRASSVNHHAIVDAAGTLRAIASRFSVIASGRALVRLPQLDLTTESARERAFKEAQRQLETWLEFFSGPDSMNASAAREIAQTHPPDVLAKPIDEFSSRLKENSYARTESWSFEQRRVMLAELQTMRRLEVLISDLNRYLAQIPGPSRSAAAPYKDRLVEREKIGGSDR